MTCNVLNAPYETFRDFSILGFFFKLSFLFNFIYLFTLKVINEYPFQVVRLWSLENNATKLLWFVPVLENSLYIFRSLV